MRSDKHSRVKVHILPLRRSDYTSYFCLSFSVSTFTSTCLRTTLTSASHWLTNVPLVHLNCSLSSGNLPCYWFSTLLSCLDWLGRHSSWQQWHRICSLEHAGNTVQRKAPNLLPSWRRRRGGGGWFVRPLERSRLCMVLHEWLLKCYLNFISGCDKD